MENVFAHLPELLKSGRTHALVIVVKTEGSAPRKAGTKMIVLGDGRTLGTMGGGELEERVITEALDAIEKRSPKVISFTLDVQKGKLDMMCGGTVEVYIEPIIPSARVFIFGAGHITKALAPLLVQAGFHVRIVDDDAKLLNGYPLPDVIETVTGDMANIADDLQGDSDTYIVLLSRGFSRDRTILKNLITKNFKYIGMIGSANKIHTMKEDIIKDGIEETALSKLKAPVGLDIGAETPDEIAISIAAELIAVRSNKLCPYHPGSPGGP